MAERWNADRSTLAPEAAPAPRGSWPSRPTGFLAVTLGADLRATPRYHEASARLAWERTIAFFKKHLA